MSLAFDIAFNSEVNSFDNPIIIFSGSINSPFHFLLGLFSGPEYRS
jgi:hypothetical protein